MADSVTTTSQFSRPRTRRMQEAVHHLYPPPEPTVAFGFVLDHQCRRCWATYFLEEAQKEEPLTYTPKEYEEDIEGIMLALNSSLPNYIYRDIPDLPRIRTDLLLVEDPTYKFDRLVFALRDNSTSERLHAPLTPEHIETVRKQLRLGDDQQPRWYRIAKLN